MEIIAKENVKTNHGIRNEFFFFLFKKKFTMKNKC